MGEGHRPHQDDAALVARAQAGDVDAFGQLYERYFDPVFRYLRSRVSDEREAEDLSATVFLRAYQALDRYQERGWKFSAFLYGIARNALADHFRRSRDEVLAGNIESDGAPVVGLDQEIASRESMEQLRGILAALPQDYQEVIRLRLILGLSTPEAAQWMRRSEGAVRVLLHRALRAARKRILSEDETRDRS